MRCRGPPVCQLGASPATETCENEEKLIDKIQLKLALKFLSQSLSTNFIIVTIPAEYNKIFATICCCHFCENSALQECCKKQVPFCSKSRGSEHKYSSTKFQATS